MYRWMLESRTSALVVSGEIVKAFTYLPVLDCVSSSEWAVGGELGYC